MEITYLLNSLEWIFTLKSEHSVTLEKEWKHFHSLKIRFYSLEWDSTLKNSKNNSNTKNKGKKNLILYEFINYKY